MVTVATSQASHSDMRPRSSTKYATAESGRERRTSTSTTRPTVAATHSRLSSAKKTDSVSVVEDMARFAPDQWISGRA